MKSNFYDQGMNVIAHHYFSGKKDVRQIRHNVQFSSVSLSRWENAKTWADQEKEQNGRERTPGQRPEFQTGDISGYRGRPTNANDQEATSQGTYVISSLSELESVMKNGQSGQMLDLRDHRISPEVYAALARGEKVEVQMQQMAPERVNLFTPLLASAMQIFGGMGGGVAYNEDLSQVITGKGGTDKGQLGKAAEFVNKHGSAYDLGLGTGEHIDVVAKFRVLNQEGQKKLGEPPIVKTPGYVAPDRRKVELEKMSDQHRFERESPLVGEEPKIETTNISSGSLDKNIRLSPVDNGNPTVAIKPLVIDYKYIDKQGNGRTEDQNAHSFLEDSYKGQYGSSGKVNNLTGKSALADSSSTIRGISPKSTLKDGSGADWYKNAIKNGTYPVKAAQDFLKLAVGAELISAEDLIEAKNNPEVLGKLFAEVEDKLGPEYHLRDSGNLGSAHIRALENALIDKAQSLNGAISFTTIAASQGQGGVEKLNKYESLMSGDTKLNNLSVPAEIARIEKITNPTQRQAAREELTKNIGTWLKESNFSEQEATALKDLSPKDVTNIKNELAKNNISLAKVASGDMTGVVAGITEIENKLHSISDAIKSSGYDDSRLPQFQQLKSQVDEITGGKDGKGEDSPTGSVDTLKSLIQAKTSGEGAQFSIGSLANKLSEISKQGQLLPDSEINQAKISLDKGGQGLQTQIKSFGLNTELKDIKAELAKPDSKLSIEANKSPELKANLENFVKADELLTQQTDLSGGLKALQRLQEKFKKGENISNEELSDLKNHGNPILDAGINQLKKAKDIKDVNTLSNKLTSSSPQDLTEDDKTKLEELKVKYSSDTKLVDVIDSVINGSKSNRQNTVQKTGKIADEYNIMTGTREYLVPFAKDLEDKGVNIDSLKIGGKIDPDKVLNFARALQSVGNPPDLSKIDSIATKETKDLITSISNLSNKDDVSSLVKKSADIGDKFRSQAQGGLDLHRTTDQETVEVIRDGYKLVNGDAGVKLKNKTITTTASAVEINPATLKNPNIMNMMQDYFKLSVVAKNLTQEEVNKAGSDPVKVDALFKKLEHTLHEKYGLKEDQLFGAEHINDLQESLYDEAKMVNEGVIAIDKLYEGKELSTTETSKLDSLLKEYKSSGKTPAIDSIKDLKDNKELAVSLLDFSKDKLTSIKTTINSTHFEKYGQLAELSRDIDRVIGSESNQGVGLIALKNAIKDSKGLSTTPDPSASKDYKDGLKECLNNLSKALTAGHKEVKIDQKDGKGEQTVKVIDYVKQLEKEYQTFLLDTDNDERSEVTDMANLFTKVHLDAGLAAGDSKDNIFSELQGALGLSLEASNIDIDNLLLGKAGKSTADSKTITNQLIGKMSQPELGSKLKGTMDEKGDVNKVKLLEAMSAKFSELTDVQVKEFLAVAERLLKKARPDANPAIDLTGIYENSKKTGKSIEEAFKTSIDTGKTALK